MDQTARGRPMDQIARRRPMDRAGPVFREALGELDDMGPYVLSPKTIYMYACVIYTTY